MSILNSVETPFAIPHSNAAEELKPEPIGKLLLTVMSKPEIVFEYASINRNNTPTI